MAPTLAVLGLLNSCSEQRFSHFTVRVTGIFGSWVICSSSIRAASSGLYSVWGLLSISSFRIAVLEWAFFLSSLSPSSSSFLLFLHYVQSGPLWAVDQGPVFLNLFFFDFFCLPLLSPRLLVCLFVLFRRFAGTRRVLNFWRILVFRHVPLRLHCCALASLWQNCNRLA